MAVNESRDMRAELEYGTTEGRYKSRNLDRGGQVNAETQEERADLFNGVNGYNILDTPLEQRELPTGRWAKHTSGRGANSY